MIALTHHSWRKKDRRREEEKRNLCFSDMTVICYAVGNSSVFCH